MLPNINLLNQNQVTPSEITESRFKNRVGQINSAISERLNNIASPKMIAQTGVINTFGNNMISQAIMQFGGLLSDIASKVTGAEKDRDDVPERQEKHYEVSDNLLREILKSLLRMEKLGGMGGAPDKKTKAAWTPTSAHDRIDLEKERKSAQDIIARLEQKSPVPKKNMRDQLSPFQEHLSNVTANVRASTEQGFYNAFGYNILTQSATEGLGMMEDLFKGMFAGKVKDQGEAKNDPEFKETKESNNILKRILSSMQELNKTFKDYFAVKDTKISSLETDFESGLKEKVKSVSTLGTPTPTGLIPKVKDSGEQGRSFLQVASDLAEIGVFLELLYKTKIPGKLMGGIRLATKFLANPSMWKNVAKGAGPVGLAATPLLAMNGVSDWVEDTSHDERVSGIQENVQAPLESFLSKIGLNFSDKFEKQRQKNRAELGGDEYYQTPAESAKSKGLTWESVSPPKKSDVLNNSAQAPEKKAVQANNQTTVLNNQTVNNQTILPNRNTVRNTESTVNRYFNKEYQ